MATAFRKQLGDDNRIVIDCNGFRRDKDAELRQMATFMAEKARSERRAAGDGPAEPLRAPHRAHGDRRGSRR